MLASGLSVDQEFSALRAYRSAMCPATGAALRAVFMNSPQDVFAYACGKILSAVESFWRRKRAQNFVRPSGLKDRRGAQSNNQYRVSSGKRKNTEEPGWNSQR